MGLRKLAFLLVCALLGAAVAVLPAVAGSETTPATITAINSEGFYGEQHHYWSPATVTVGPGGVVAFSNPSGTVMHGLEWTAAPATPSCSGVPGAGASSWHGECAFTQPGAYYFRCTVHPTEMTGTVTVSSTGTTTTTATTQTGTTTAGGGATTTTQTTPGQLGQTAPASLLSGPSAQALRLSASQRGRAVRGSVEVSQAAAGGRLEVDLLARSAALAGAGHAVSVEVGRLVRTALVAGHVAFKVALRARAARALRVHHRLALTVRILLAAPHAASASLQIRRSVVLHA
jgi:plastocyanin